MRKTSPIATLPTASRRDLLIRGAWVALGLLTLGRTGRALAGEGHPGMKEGHGEPGYRQDPNFPKGVIGIALQLSAKRVGDPAALYVGTVHPEGPAGKAGLTHGDEIVSVDGAALTGKTYEQVVAMVRGEVGASVKLGVRRDTSLQEMTMVRVAEEDLYRKKKTT
jgi:membrane-associated protease RseP (regulator of RpoE activity)